MEIFIGNQLKNIGYSIILGLIFGTIYDIICIMHIIIGVVSDSGDKARRTDIPARVIFFLTDLLYMTVITVMLSVFLYEFADGDLRVYLLAAAAAGFIVYRCTLGRLVSAVSEVIVRLLRAVVRTILIRPLKFVTLWLGVLMRWLYRHTLRLLTEAMRCRLRERYLKYALKRLTAEIRLDQI